MYKEVDSKFDLVKTEKNVLKFWNRNKIFEKVNKLRKKSKSWVYYDGPITANGVPHYGHAITWTMKDVLPRYHTMKGEFVSRNIGWDCQGILVEYEVEKALKFQHKNDIEKMGIDRFNEACRKSVLKYRQKMLEYETRLGRWIDHNDEYSTMDSKYIESVWWAIKELYNKGLLYRGHKVVAYSTRAGMTLSSHEVADGGYKDVEDPGVTLMFELLGGASDKYILAWTTTPWTLPSNLMLAIGKKIQYAEVYSEAKTYILAKKTIKRVFGTKKYKVIRDISAKELLGKEYKPLFDFYENKREEGAFKIIFADHVNTEEGTGIVHLAPYGEEDFAIFLEMGMRLFDYLDETGQFTSEIPPYEGQFYKKANKQIILDLSKKGLLYKEEKYVHSVPVSYRTKEVLIYKPIESWYVAVNKFKKELIAEAKKTKWVPQQSGRRFVDWVKNARDWSLSRMRYWGTPLPIWQNDKTGEFVVVGSFSELSELSGQKLTQSFDPHKPFVDEITWKGPSGGVFRRLPEVIDVWFDSGSMPYARYHYPFENIEKFKSRFPADYISESDDQIRLWFYTMFVLSVGLFNKSPFKNVVVTGMLGDDKGKKMSKSKGNFPPIEEVFEKWGADMLRYFLLTSPITRGEFTSFSYDYLLETKKEFFTMVWNSYRYFVTYARLYKFEGDVNVRGKNVLDVWIIARINETIKRITGFFDDYEVMDAARELSPLANDISTWYIRRSRDRISSGDKNALATLSYVLVQMSKIMAPIMPLLSESIYQNLVVTVNKGARESVHLCDYPKFDEQLIVENKNLLKDMDVVRNISSLGNAIRKKVKIPVRQPLAILEVSGASELNDTLLELVRAELNVKNVKLVDKISSGDNWKMNSDGVLKVVLNTEISEKLLIEGYARELMREIQKLRKNANVKWKEKVKVSYPDEEKYQKAVKVYGKQIKEKTLATTLEPGKRFKIL